MPEPDVSAANTFDPLLIGSFTLAIEAAILCAMHRHRIFLRI
jgi:hypothetical protein